MRRAVLILAASVATLLAAASAASGAEAPIRDVKFELHEGGFLVSVKSEISEEKVVLSLYRHGEVAVYETGAEFTDDTMKARFGQLGELDYTFTPVKGARLCGEGNFEGTFVFTGENEYVKFEAPRARGTFLVPSTRGCTEGRRATASRMTAVKAKPKAGKEEASLLVHDSTRPLRSMVVFEGEAKHRRNVFFSAFQSEKLEGMLIARGAQQIGPPRDFTWNLKAGTARIAPPAPFTGSATFERRIGAKPRWSGSLRVPLLGGQPFPLAGGDFQAQLIKGSILD
ncbi:MAG: hypothetical protein ACRDPE_01300 [Solirubrobacterales bacterium]